MGFQLFICFVNYYDLHCIHSRRRHVAILNRKVSFSTFRASVKINTCTAHTSMNECMYVSHCVFVCTYIYICYLPALLSPDREILARGHENEILARGPAVSNVFIFFCAILNQIRFLNQNHFDIPVLRTRFEVSCVIVVFVTLLQVWLTNSQEDMTKKVSFSFDCCFSTQHDNEKGKFIKIVNFPVVLQKEHD